MTHTEEDDGEYYSNIDTPDLHTRTEEELKAKKPRCMHKEIKNYKCTACDFEVKNFLSWFDSGTLQTYIRVLFLSESD